MSLRRTLAALAPAIIWAAVVLYIGGRSSVPAPRVDLPLDKAAHFVMYFILGLLAARGARQSWHRIGWGWFVAAGLFLGAIDEYRQSFIPSRSADPLDWVADALGFTIAFWLFYRQRRALERG